MLRTAGPTSCCGRSRPRELAERSAPYRGHDGVRAYLHDVASLYEELTFTPLELRRTENSVIGFGRIETQGANAMSASILDRAATAGQLSPIEVFGAPEPEATVRAARQGTQRRSGVDVEPRASAARAGGQLDRRGIIARSRTSRQDMPSLSSAAPPSGSRYHLDGLQHTPKATPVPKPTCSRVQDRGAGGLEDTEVRGGRGHRRDVDGEEHRRGLAGAHLVSRPSATSRMSREPLHPPGPELGGGGRRAELRQPEDDETGAHAGHRLTRLADHRCSRPKRARRRAAAAAAPARPAPQRGGRPGVTSAFGGRRRGPPMENITAKDRQRDELSKVCETRCRGRREVLARAAGAPGDDQRTRRLTEARRQRRGHQHADKRALHRVRQSDPRGRHRGLEDRVPGDGAQRHRAAHHRQAEQHERRTGGEQHRRDVRKPILLSASTASTTAPSETDANATAGRPPPTVAPLGHGGGGSRLGRRRAGTRGLRSAARAPTATASTLAAATGLRRRDRIAVGLHHVRRRRAARRSVRRRRRPHGPARCGARARPRGPAAPRRAPGHRPGHEHAVDAIADDVPSRRCRRRQPASGANASSTPSRSSRRPATARIGHRRAGARHACAGHRPCRAPAHRCRRRATGPALHATGRSPSARRGSCRERLERAQQQRQPFALDRLADEQDPQPVEAAAQRPPAWPDRGVERGRRWGSRGSGR